MDMYCDTVYECFQCQYWFSQLQDTAKLTVLLCGYYSCTLCPCSIEWYLHSYRLNIQLLSFLPWYLHIQWPLRFTNFFNLWLHYESKCFDSNEGIAIHQRLLQSKMLKLNLAPFCSNKHLFVFMDVQAKVIYCSVSAVYTMIYQLIATV